MQEKFCGKRVYWIVTLDHRPAHVQRSRKLPRILFASTRGTFATLYRRRADAECDVVEQRKWDRENDAPRDYGVVPIGAELR